MLSTKTIRNTKLRNSTYGDFPRDLNLLCLVELRFSAPNAITSVIAERAFSESDLLLHIGNDRTRTFDNLQP